MRADKTNELAIAEDADEAMDEFEREHKLESEREADLAASGHRTHKAFRQSASSRSKSRQ
jgi:hypothetical protein